MKTSYSRHELYALGEPLGDSATRKEGNRVIYGGGGGGAPTQTSSTVTQTNLPTYAQPYVESMLGATQQQLFTGPGGAPLTKNAEGYYDIGGFQPYKAYGGTYDASGKQISYDPSKGIAGFQPMQQTAQQGIQDMKLPGQYDTAANTTQDAMNRAMGMQYNPAAINVQQVAAPNLQNYQMGPAREVSAQQVGVPTMDAAQTGYNPQLQNYQMGPAERVSTQSFAQPGSAEAYMSPYMQNVVDIQKREAARQSGIQGAQQQAQAAQAGAFGGGRDAILRAERERNLSQQMGDIQAQGSQAAFQQAQQQFNAEQQARLAAQQANQQAGLTVGGQNLAANLGVQQLGTQTGLQTALANLSNRQQAAVQNQAAQLQAQGMNSQQALQAALANQQAGLTVGGQNLNALLGIQQLGAGQNLQAQLANQQALAQAQQLQAQQQQFGANYGLQGLQTGLQGANQLAALGGQKLQAQQGIYGLQNQYGAQQQALEQQKLNQAMQDYANAQQYPLMQLGTMSNMLRGLPMQASTSQMYQAQPNLLTQGIGAAGSLASLYNAYNKPGGAAGGLPSEFKYAKGGIAAIPRYDVGGQVASQLQQMDDKALENEAKTSPSPKIREMAQAILKQRQAGMDTSSQMQQGVGPMNVDYNANYAGGGIIAFANRGEVDEAEAARLANQTQMYIQGAQQAAAERQAQEAAAAANTETPVGMSTPPARPSLMKGINAALQGVANKVSRPIPASMMADTTEAPAGITAVRRSPRAAEFAAARNPAPAMAPKGGPAPAPAPAEATQGEASYTGTELSPDALKAYQDAAAKGNAGAAAALQAYYKKFPQNTEAAPNSIMAAAPKTDASGVPVVDIPEFMKQERERIVGEQGKTAGSYYDQMQQEMKDRGLINDEARQQYMKDAMAAKANLQEEAERTRNLRLAEFFASWGSTPGDTLAAGMAALKAKIPDMIADVKDQRKALAEANDLIYKIGEATRQEQLGNWDKATKLKEDAAGRAEKFNERLTQYMYHVQDTVMQTQTNRANALTQAASAANVADIHGKYQIKAAEITDRTRQAVQAGQLDVKQQALIEKSAGDVRLLAEKLERDANKPGSAYAAAVKAIQDAALVSDPESPLKKKAAKAQEVINDIKAQHERILSNAWQQTENLVKKYAGPDYVQGINPYASSTASNHPADIKSLIDKYAVPAK